MSAVPPFCSRVVDLLEAIRRQGGTWTTHRVLATHQRNGHSAPKRATARRDLDLLTRAGYLNRHCEPGRDFFTLSESKGGAR
ncbi:hypothetical protein AB0K09_04170 [Streptomyces sp. NPDC049577]|uniref:hypothetical protein n=1 Tax=Streptomyces sp. NPDC049577 TaxID=3155153 RepID=UPI003439B19E